MRSFSTNEPPRKPDTLIKSAPNASKIRTVAPTFPEIPPRMNQAAMKVSSASTITSKCRDALPPRRWRYAGHKVDHPWHCCQHARSDADQEKVPRDDHQRVNA
jgi:hypothetical protein